MKPLYIGVFSLALCACTTVPASGPNPTATIREAPTDDAIAALADRVAAWSPETAQQVREASTVLLTQCPYNRSVFQVPVALEVAIRTTDPATLPPEVRGVWGLTARDLARHVSVFDTITGGELTPPGIVDYNFDLAPRTVVTRAELEADPDPIARTALLQDQVEDRVRAMPALVQDQVTAATDVFRAHTDDGWPPVTLIETTQARLETVRALLPDGPQRDRVDAMLKLIERRQWQAC